MYQKTDYWYTFLLICTKKPIIGTRPMCNILTFMQVGWHLMCQILPLKAKVQRQGEFTSGRLGWGLSY